MTLTDGSHPSDGAGGVAPADVMHARQRFSRSAVVGGLFTAAIALAVAAVLLPVQPARADRPLWLYAVLAATLVAALVLGLATRRRDPLRVTAALAVAGAALSGWSLLADVRGGLPTRVFALMLGAFVAVLVGSVLLRRPPRSRTRHPRSRTAGVGLVVAALVGVGALGVSEIAVRVPVRASAADSAAAAVTATVPKAVRWRYDLPDGQRVADRGVVAAGSGAAVLLDDGVVAVDGATGAVRWQYRRAGARATQLVATADGAHVAVLFRSGAHVVDGTLLVLLDGQTGRVGGELVKRDDLGPFRFTTTDRVLLSGGGVDGDDDGTVVARSLVEGSTSWTWPVPDGCSMSDVEGGVGTALVLLFCPQVDRQDQVARGTFRVVGLDDVTGRQRWVHEDRIAIRSSTPLAGAPRSLVLTGSPQVTPGHDGSAAQVSWSVEAATESADHQLDSRRYVLAVDDGRVLTAATELSAEDYPISYDDRATVVQSRGRTYRRLPSDGSTPHTLPQTIGAGAQVADIGGSLVQAGVDDVDPGRLRELLVVSPWDGSPGTRLTLDLRPRPPSGFSDQLRQLPGVLVVAVSGATQVVAVG